MCVRGLNTFRWFPTEDVHVNAHVVLLEFGAHDSFRVVPMALGALGRNTDTAACRADVGPPECIPSAVKGRPSD